MGHAHDAFLEVDENLDKWVGEGDAALKMWEKRVLITQLAAAAWEKVCETFDFEKAATRLGMRMTIDGSGDDLIKIQGVYSYTSQTRMVVMLALTLGWTLMSWPF